MKQEENTKVRTRYAPSPTGFFHIGGARSALLNYLFAKHYNGTFVFRAEDTDIDRNVEGGIDVQLNGLEWLGIVPDESPRNPGEFGPYIQSGKFERFKKLAEKLVEEGKAYYCFCTPEELENARQEALKNNLPPKYNGKCKTLTKEEIAKKKASGLKPAIRLAIPENIYFEWNDIVRGKISVPSSALGDPVILKSNGIPTYNFAVVCDDHEMQITHVLRAEEHISNTPYQIAVMYALGYGVKIVEDKYIPEHLQFGHLSIIVDETGKKLSKRNKALKQFISAPEGEESYMDLGYVPQAITNFIALLGWSPKTNQEIFTLSELVEQFDETRLNTAPAYFDMKKMNWISGEYLKKMSDAEYLEFAKPFVKQELKDVLADKLELSLLTFKTQISYCVELNGLLQENFIDVVNLDNVKEVYAANGITDEEFALIAQTLSNVLKDYPAISVDNTNEIIEKIKVTSGLKGKKLFLPIRLLAIGKEHGPEMPKILTIVGKEKLQENVNKYLDK